jgi:hypothetical protein
MMAVVGSSVSSVVIVESGSLCRDGDRIATSLAVSRGFGELCEWTLPKVVIAGGLV